MLFVFAKIEDIINYSIYFLNRFVPNLFEDCPKAFGSLGAASLSKAAFQSPEKSVLFYATDDSVINVDIED